MGILALLVGVAMAAKPPTMAARFQVHVLLNASDGPRDFMWYYDFPGQREKIV
jgi:hypothetical protein